MATTSRVYEFRYRFLLGPFGWEEAYRFACTAGTLAAAAGAADRLATLRVACMSYNAVIDEGSIVPVAVWDPDTGAYAKPTDQGSVLLTSLYGTTYRGQIKSDVADPNTAVDVRVTAANALYRRVLQIRACAGKAVNFEEQDRFVVVGGVNTQVALNDFLKRLVNMGANRDPAGVYVLKGKSKLPTVALPNKIVAAQADPTGCHTILTLASPTTYAQGETVHVHGAFGCNSRGLNGDTTVMAVGPGNLITIRKKASCCGAPLVNPGGEVTKVSFSYYALENVLGATSQVAPLANRLRRRKTGRQRAAARGRARKHCV